MPLKFLLSFFSMRNSLSFLLLATITLAACKKNNTEPSSTYGSGNIELISGDAQSGVYGELLEDDIVLKITSSNARNCFKVFYRTVQGNGNIEMYSQTLTEPRTIETPGEEMIINWRMGCDNDVQKVVFYVYTDSLIPND